MSVFNVATVGIILQSSAQHTVAILILSARQLSLKTSNSISVASLHLMYQLTHFCVDEANSNKKTKEDKTLIMHPLYIHINGRILQAADRHEKNIQNNFYMTKKIKVACIETNAKKCIFNSTKYAFRFSNF